MFQARAIQLVAHGLHVAHKHLLCGPQTPTALAPLVPHAFPTLFLVC